MKAYCERKGLDVYGMIPLTFAVDFSEVNYTPKFDQILSVISTIDKNVHLLPSELSEKLVSTQ